MNTIKKLQSMLPEKVDCLLVTCEKNQRYISGLNYTDVVQKSGSFFSRVFR